MFGVDSKENVLKNSALSPELYVISKSAKIRENWLISRRQPSVIETSSGAIHVVPAGPIHELRNSHRWLVGNGRWGDNSVTWAIPRSVAQLLVTNTVPEIVCDDLSPDLLSACVEAALHGIREALERATSKLITTESVVERDASHLTNCAVRVEFHGGLKVPILMQLEADDLAQFDVWVASLAEDRTVTADIACRVGFRIGYCTLSRAEFMTLKPGDGLLMANVTDGVTAMAVLSGRFAQACNKADSGWRLAGPLMTPIAPHLKNFTDVPELHAMENSQIDERVTLETLPIHLVFELGQLEIPFKELTSLDTGYVFELPRQPKASVDIRAAGKKIGVGEVVQIGEVLGVRITWINR